VVAEDTDRRAGSGEVLPRVGYNQAPWKRVCVDMPITLDDQVRLLSMVEVLEPLSSEELKELGRRAPDVQLEEGDILIEPQEDSERLFVLKKGRVQVYEVNSKGEETTLSVVDEGNIFGEMVLSGQRLSGVYARALEPSVVCSLKRADLERIILRHPEVGLRLVRRLSEQLREAEVRLGEITSKDVTARLASLILRLAESEGVVTGEDVMVPTRYTQERLGTMIGAKRVAVTRAFNHLRNARAVEVKRRHIHITDAEALKRIADAGR
jgi:CRP/FNR family transcriptional regulator, cyclic AMP receptor protein